jgi:DNA-binding GntR family transcriptional regulator
VERRQLEDWAHPQLSACRIQRNRLSSQVADIVREQVLTGELLPGQRIVQAEWAERLGVSRMPVRDAINSLCAEGLLIQRSSGSAEVTPLDLEGMEDVFQLNAMTIALCARRAATRITQEELARLGELNSSMARAVEAGELHEASELNWRFHRVVNLAARSPRLVALLRILVRSIPHGGFEMLPDWPAQACEDHAVIIGALRARDGERAYRVTREHTVNGTEPLLRQLDKRLSLRPAPG